jgi:cystathionine beta-lyase
LPSRDELAAVAALAERHGALVVSDEIWAPLTLPGGTHVPFASVGGWPDAHVGLQGLQPCRPGARGALRARRGGATRAAGYPDGGALGDGSARRDRDARRLATRRRVARGRAGDARPQSAALRALAGRAAARRALGGPPGWLPGVARLRRLGAGRRPRQGSPRAGRVAHSRGPTFGAEGRGFARVNPGTSPAVLDEIVRHLVSSLSPV